MGDSFDAWLDKVANGGGVSADEFAQSALGTIPTISERVSRPSRQDVWPADEWERMCAIWRGEEDGQ